MAINWYPIIDYEKCTACLACIEFCPHNVFIEANGKTLVANPDNCIEFCRGCQKGACEDDAIMFLETAGYLKLRLSVAVLAIQKPILKRRCKNEQERAFALCLSGRVSIVQRDEHL